MDRLYKKYDSPDSVRSTGILQETRSKLSTAAVGSHKPVNSDDDKKNVLELPVKQKVSSTMKCCMET